MPTIRLPDYQGNSLVNLVAELERRLSGGSPGSPLLQGLSRNVPEGESYVLVIFDGLGSAQLEHRAAGSLRGAFVASIDTTFPTTTTVAMSSVATALPPSQHGLLGYQLWLPEVDAVVNTIHWTKLWGEEIDYSPDDFLPAPNLWERLSGAGFEPITVQPANFAESKLSRALYRGCRFEPAYSIDELVRATLDLAGRPRRLIVTYLPHVDFAAHVFGQDSAEYEEALGTVTGTWDQLAAHLPRGATLVGTSDHGHVDFPVARQARIAKPDHKDRTFYGDGRAMFVRGEGASLAERLPASWVPFGDMETWWGPAPFHRAFLERAPDGVLLADDDVLLLHRFSDDRMIGNHGALTDAERLVPLLVAT